MKFIEIETFTHILHLNQGKVKELTIFENYKENWNFVHYVKDVIEYFIAVIVLSKVNLCTQTPENQEIWPKKDFNLRV